MRVGLANSVEICGRVLIKIDILCSALLRSLNRQCSFVLERLGDLATRERATSEWCDQNWNSTGCLHFHGELLEVGKEFGLGDTVGGLLIVVAELNGHDWSIVGDMVLYFRDDSGPVSVTSVRLRSASIFAIICTDSTVLQGRTKEAITPTCGMLSSCYLIYVH